MKQTAIKLKAPLASSNHVPYLLAGIIAILLGFGVLGAWAAVAKLDSAVVANGMVAVESNRKTIQHYEGGIVEAILVKEGDIVQDGDVLLRLQPIQASASVDTNASQLDTAQATEARLVAERSLANEITFPDRLKARMSLPETSKIIADQISQFKERRGTLDAEIGVLLQRIEQLKEEITGLAAVRDANKDQLDNMQAEVDKVKDLADRGFFPVNRLNAMQRNIAQLAGQYGQTVAEISKNQKSISETQFQIIQTKSKFQEDVAAQLREIRVQVAEYTEKLRVSSDVLTRNEIRAPQAGTVQNLHFHTLGGVVRQGEPILDIVPLNDAFNVRARVSPMDVNHVHPGLEAEVRFPGFKSRTAPLILGSVRNISADAMADEKNNEPYFLAIIEVKNSSLPPELQGKLTAGMPTEVLIATGERTVVDYLVGPLTEAMRKVMREY